MTQSNEEKRQGARSPWEVTIGQRLAKIGAKPVDTTSLEARIAAEIPRPAQAAPALQKKKGCAPAVLLTIAFFAAGLVWRVVFGRRM